MIYIKAILVWTVCTALTYSGRLFMFIGFALQYTSIWFDAIVTKDPIAMAAAKLYWKQGFTTISREEYGNQD